MYTRQVRSLGYLGETAEEIYAGPIDPDLQAKVDAGQLSDDQARNYMVARWLAAQGELETSLRTTVRTVVRGGFEDPNQKYYAVAGGLVLGLAAAWLMSK